jgi:peptidoglycan-associated lipoprotein
VRQQLSRRLTQPNDHEPTINDDTDKEDDMQNASSQVTTGTIAPAIARPRKDRDVAIVAGLVLGLATVIGAIWYYSSDLTPEPNQLHGSQVSEVLKSRQPAVIPVSLPMANIQEPPVGKIAPAIIHTDLYFEVGRQGLTDEARTLLQKQATILKNDANLGVLVQGYTDLQGTARYNMELGLKRAETVKSELIRAGVGEDQIKVVSLGESGALCLDNSDVCRQMNRRVHLEVRTIGREHMTVPVTEASPAESTPLSEPKQPNGDSGPFDGLLPTADAPPQGTVEFQPSSGS